MRWDMSLPLVVCEYDDVFLDELQGLLAHRDIDFIIELHCDAPKPGCPLTTHQPVKYL